MPKIIIKDVAFESYAHYLWVSNIETIKQYYSKLSYDERKEYERLKDLDYQKLTQEQRNLIHGIANDCNGRR